MHELLDFLNGYGEKFLGKTSVMAKDTPAFIGNRIGIFGIQSLISSGKRTWTYQLKKLIN